jgi:hypothetical protein
MVLEFNFKLLPSTEEAEMFNNSKCIHDRTVN